MQAAHPSATHPVNTVVPAATVKSRMPGGDRRKQLLRVAIESFARNGFGGTKTKDIAAAAGVSEAILFRHFATKEDLYHAILDEKELEEKGADFARVEEAMLRSDDAGVLRVVGTQILRSFREDPAFHRLMLYAGLEGHVMAGLFQNRFAAPRGDHFRRYISQRQQAGAFRKCDPQIALMMSVGAFVHFAMSRYVVPMKTSTRSDDQAIEEIVTFALAGLTNPGVDRPKDIHSKKVSAGAPESHLNKNNKSRKTRKGKHAKS